MKHRNDEAYERGHKDGKDGFLLGDIAHSLGDAIPSIDPDADSAYDKGYRKGCEDRPGWFDDVFSSDDSSDDSSSDSGSICFVTTACVRSMGRSDDCEELSVLRKYRDTYLASRDDGHLAIQQYYQMAPHIVAAIDQSPNADSAFKDIYERIVQPTVQMIKHGQNESAFDHYKTEVERLAKLYIHNSPTNAT